MQVKDSAARRLHTLLTRLQQYWGANYNLHSAWQKVFSEEEVPMPASEIQALLGQLLSQIKTDAQALDPNPPASSTLIHFDEWAKACFGRGFDPVNTGLHTSQFVSPQAHGHLLVLAALVERELCSQEIASTQVISLHERTEELLKEMRVDTTLPAELRLRLIQSLVEIAEAIRLYRVTGSYGIDNAARSLISTISTTTNVDKSRGALGRILDYTRYLVILLRLGQAGASLIEGDVDEAVDLVIDASTIQDVEPEEQQ